MKAFAPAAAVALLLAAATAAHGLPLFDRKPTEIDGVRYGPEKVFEGDYISNPESSVFRPMGRPKDMMWLVGWAEPAGDTTAGPSRTYHIRFIGRRTTKPGKYGNLRAFSHQVVIAELINAEIEPAP
jgi:hypothetical protein